MKRSRFGNAAIVSFFLALVFGASAFAQEEEEPEMLYWHSYYPEALEEARKTGKPIFLEFRCAPCVNGREFDAKVVYTPLDSKRGKLMSQYVCARITTMTGVNIAHFDRDWHNSLYYFIINADEEIYLRYGGRDEESATTYLNFESLELALEIGLDEHRRRSEDSEAVVKGPEKELVPSDYKLLKTNVIETGRCTECHLIADYSMQEKDLAGLLEPITDLYRSPDIKKLGLHLDIPKGLLLESTSGAAAEVGFQAGDTIIAFNGKRVLTFGDLQYQYDKVPRPNSTEVTLTVDRDGTEVEATIDLPFEWWKTGLEFRHWTPQPRLFFESTPLTRAEKAERNYPEDGFAARVDKIDIEAILSGYHGLEIGDIVLAVNRTAVDPLTTDLEDHFVLHYPPGSEVELTVLRGDDIVSVPLKTQQQNFRKEEVDPASSGLAVTWSEPEYVYRGNDKVVRYRATVYNKHLIVEARHEHGWHSYAIDNPARAEKKLGRKGADQELPTVIALPKSLKTSGDWMQTEPTDFSKPEIHWHTWGFEGRAWFAISLDEMPGEPVTITVSSQVCDAESCAGTFDLELVVPVSPGAEENLFIRNLLESLEPILSAEEE